MTQTFTKNKKTSLAKWVDHLQSTGIYSFNRTTAEMSLGKTSQQLTRSLNVLVRSERIARPRKCFYVIVPLEYRRVGSPPVSWFIDELMEHFGTRYYVGLLTAASLHGASHQASQVFQVISEKPLRPIALPRTNIQFATKTKFGTVGIEQKQTETGYMKVSSPELTALDLVRYFKICGHLSHVATVLDELQYSMTAERLSELLVSELPEDAVLQRLGYLLELIEAEESLILSIEKHLQKQTIFPVALVPGKLTQGCETSSRWKIRINTIVESDMILRSHVIHWQQN